MGWSAWQRPAAFGAEAVVSLCSGQALHDEEDGRTKEGDDAEADPPTREVDVVEAADLV